MISRFLIFKIFNWCVYIRTQNPRSRKTDPSDSPSDSKCGQVPQMNINSDLTHLNIQIDLSLPLFTSYFDVIIGFSVQKLGDFGQKCLFLQIIVILNAKRALNAGLPLLFF